MVYNNSPQSELVNKKNIIKSNWYKTKSPLASGVLQGENKTNSTGLGTVTLNGASAKQGSNNMSIGGRTDYNGQGITPSTELTGSGSVPVTAGTVASTPTLKTTTSTTPKMTALTPTTTTEELPVELQPKDVPTLNDFIEEAKKLGQESVQSQIDLLMQNLPEFQQGLARKLYGSNVGAMSGVGSDIVGKATGDYLGKLTPYIQQAGTELGQMALQNQQQELQNMFELVQSGQLTGAQAEQTLRQKGINPEDYMTPEQADLKQKETQLNTLKEQLRKDPNFSQYSGLVDLIDTIDEYNYVLTNGRTYEDEMADIFSKRKTLNEWKTIVNSGKLQQQISRLEKQIMDESSKSGNWLPWEKPDTGKLGKLQAQVSALKEVIASVEAGVNPIYDINEYKGELSTMQDSPSFINKALLGVVA